MCVCGGGVHGVGEWALVHGVLGVHGVGVGGCVFTVWVGVGVCSLLCVCTLGGLNAEHKFRVGVTILGRMSLHSLLSLMFDRMTLIGRLFIKLLLTDLLEKCKHVLKKAGPDYK